MTGFYQDENSPPRIHGFTLQGSTLNEVRFPGAPSTWAIGINKRGAIVGSYTSNNTSKGFRLVNGQFKSFFVPGSASTNLYSISNTGVMVGISGTHGLIVKNGAFEIVDHPLGTDGTELKDINSLDVVVGNYEDTNLFFHGFIYKNGALENIVYPGEDHNTAGGINDKEQSQASFLSRMPVRKGTPRPATRDTSRFRFCWC